MNSQMELRIEHEVTADYISGKQSDTLRLCLSVDQLRNGLIKDIGARNFSVLLAIAAHINSGNAAFPSVAKIAEITGLSSPTVIKAIQELEGTEIGGTPVIKKSRATTANGNSHSIYYFVGAEVVDEVPQQELTAKDAVILFCEHFEQTFGVKYNPTWGRDISMVKSKLIAQYPADQLREIIRIAVTQYSSFGNNPQYPTPTIGMLCTWLANKAAGVMVQEQKKEAEYSSRVAYAEKASAIDSATLLDL